MAPTITDEDGARGEGRGGIVKPSTSHTIEDLEAKVKEIAQELSGLESQHQDATSQIRRAEQKFAQLEAQRIELAPRAFVGNEKARVDLDSVELEQDELAGELREVFEVHSRVHGRYQEAVRPYDQDQANDMAGSRGAVYQSWIKKAFVRWF